MSTSAAPRKTARWTVAELLAALGDVPPERVRLDPAPGTATEQDILDIRARDGQLCELVDGVLVEKPMGIFESVLGAVLIGYLEEFLKLRDLGIVAGADGPMRLNPRLVRLPDVSFTRWERLARGGMPKAPIADFAPDLAVEILSRSNTSREVERKLREYFEAGTRLAWIVHPTRRTVRVHTAPKRARTLTEAESLDGGDVLPGFALSIRDWFARADRRGPQAI